MLCCMSYGRTAPILELAVSAGANAASKVAAHPEVDLMVTSVLQVKPDLTIESPGLCRALFEVYTGSNTVVPEAKKAWADGARQLIDSDEVSRKSRKSGGG